ncbi:MAG TPA: sigma-70 family RNA polymerase sigma factor [Blastocatellia bacterium]|nr:sigma-70 family RNA polymerase sigma factor [Blastocatellia bacterium]
MSGEVAEIALMTDSLRVGEAAETNCSPLACVIERAKAGDTAAFEQIIEQYQRRVISTAWRMLGSREDALDAAQEAFLRVYRYLRGFKVEEDFNAWLYRIVINVCRDFARRNRNARLSSFESEREAGTLDAIASGDDIEAAVIKSQQQAMILKALDTLTKKERAAIVLRDLEGLTTKEAARALGSSQTTIRSQVSSARAKIKKFYERAMKQSRRR